jgi:hypothetical protein
MVRRLPELMRNPANTGEGKYHGDYLGLESYGTEDD